MCRNDFYRSVLWLFSIISVTGNAMSFVVRIYIDGKSLGSFGVLVTSLCLADFIMGLYLGIIGAADVIFQVIFLISMILLLQSIWHILKNNWNASNKNICIFYFVSLILQLIKTIKIFQTNAHTILSYSQLKEIWYLNFFFIVIGPKQTQSIHIHVLGLLKNIV